ncbi:OmpP1/FadL family transporter [Pontiella sp.]|uniref:OmpP1/FadL family transporter n=1 Tax=Pontiella sp. TaxID=2837462 RepID=UPI003567B731
MKKRLITTALLAAAAAAPTFATEGINLIGVGPIQQGTAGAGVASAKDSTWLILNPAGLTDVDRSVDTSLQLFAPVRTVDYGMGAGETEDDSAFIIPSISTSFGCCHGENGSIGLGIYGTSGMGVDYSPAGPLGSMTELSVAKMTATYAYKFGDSGLSLGAGPIFVLSRFKTDMMGSSGDWDTAYGAGAIIGINQHLGRLTIGGSYMSEQFMSSFDTEYDSLLGDNMNLPQQLTVGAAYNVLDNVELALDYRWTGWSSLDVMGDSFGWDDQHIVKAGVTWGVSDALALRAGISHGNSPIKDEDVLMNSLFPAIVETHLACGLSYAWEDISVHFAYVHALENELTGTNAPMMPGETTISMYQNSFTLGATYRF